MDKGNLTRKNPYIKEIITDFLKNNEYDGLCGGDCGCDFNNLMHCEGET